MSPVGTAERGKFNCLLNDVCEKRVEERETRAILRLCRINTRTETYERFDRIGGTHQTSETYLTPSLVATRRQGL